MNLRYNIACDEEMYDDEEDDNLNTLKKITDSEKEDMKRALDSFKEEKGLKTK